MSWTCGCHRRGALTIWRFRNDLYYWLGNAVSIGPMLKLKHIAPLHLRVLLCDGLLQLSEGALTAEAAHAGLTMVLAAGSGSADQFIG